jgi:hypothetical protein
VGRVCLREYLLPLLHFFFGTDDPVLTFWFRRPHIAGLAALILGSEGKLSPAALKARVLSLSTSGVISGVVNGTSNQLGSTANGI